MLLVAPTPLKPSRAGGGSLCLTPQRTLKGKKVRDETVSSSGKAPHASLTSGNSIVSPRTSVTTNGLPSAPISSWLL